LTAQAGAQGDGFERLVHSMKKGESGTGQTGAAMVMAEIAIIQTYAQFSKRMATT